MSDYEMAQWMAEIFDIFGKDASPDEVYAAVSERFDLLNKSIEEELEHD